MKKKESKSSCDMSCKGAKKAKGMKEEPKKEHKAKKK